MADGGGPKFMPKVPARRKRAIKEEDTELLQMLQGSDLGPNVPSLAAEANAAHPSRAQQGGRGQGAGGSTSADARVVAPGHGTSQGPRQSNGAGAGASQAASRQPGQGGSASASAARPSAQPLFQHGAGMALAQADTGVEWLHEPEAPIVLPFRRPGSLRQSATGFPPGSAADVLLSGGDEIEGNILFLQLPPDLPTSAAHSMAPVPAKDGGVNPREFANSCKEQGTGSISKFRLCKSGKVTFQLGEVSFELRVGTDCACAQELMALSTDGCGKLGDVRARILCVPLIESLIARVNSPGGARGGGADVKPNVHAPHAGGAGGGPAAGGQGAGPSQLGPTRS